MTDKLRLSLAVSTEPRDENSLDKDAQLINCFIDKDPIGTTYVVKRPGFLVGSEGITTGLNRGIFLSPYDNDVWYVDDNGDLQNYTNPNYWNSGTTYSVNQIAYFPNEDGEMVPWYSQQAGNTNNTPVGGVFWSIEPYVSPSLPGVLFASFTVSGAILPSNPDSQDFGIYFTGTSPEYGPLIQGLSADAGGPLQGFSYAAWSGGFIDEIYGSEAMPPNGDVVDINGDWTIMLNAGSHDVYIDDVLYFSTPVPSTDLPTGFTLFDFGSVGGGTISNVVLG
jgi:hypothetical protein